MERYDEDLLLVRGAQNGDRKAFGLLYEKYAGQVRRYFVRRVGSSEAADDLMQDTFVQALEHIGKFRERGVPYSGYLFTIAHNILVNHYRQKKEFSLEGTHHIPDRASERATQAVELSLDVQSARDAADELAPGERHTVVLKYWYGRSVKEIAFLTNKTENAVKLALSRGRKKITKHPSTRHLGPVMHQGRLFAR